MKMSFKTLVTSIIAASIFGLAAVTLTVHKFKEAEPVESVQPIEAVFEQFEVVSDQVEAVIEAVELEPVTVDDDETVN